MPNPSPATPGAPRRAPTDPLGADALNRTSDPESGR